MKVKNLFRTLVVVALIVPFLFGLSACGKEKSEVKNVKATEVYETFRSALVSYNKEQTEDPNKFIMDTNTKMSIFDIETNSNIDSSTNVTMGLNLDEQKFFSYSVTIDENGNEMKTVTFVKDAADVENVKRVYMYTSEFVEAEVGQETETPVYEEKVTKIYQDFSTVKAEQENSEWETFWETIGQNFSTEIDGEGTGYVGIDITEETTFEEFEQMYLDVMNYVPDDEGSSQNEEPVYTLDNVKFSGKKYKDGSIGFVISVSERMPFEGLSLMAAGENDENLALMTINIEYIVKNNQIVGINVDSGYVQSMPDTNGKIKDIEVFGIEVSVKINRNYDESKIAKYTANLSDYEEGSIENLF